MRHDRTVYEEQPYKRTHNRINELPYNSPFTTWQRHRFTLADAVFLERMMHERSGVYLLTGKATNLTKIGCATNLWSRIFELQRMNADTLFVDGLILSDSPRQIESQIHSAYWAYRKHGEWFNLPRIDRILQRPDSCHLGISVAALLEVYECILDGGTPESVKELVGKPRSMILVSCLHCQKVFRSRPNDYHAKNKRYCSRECQAAVKSAFGRDAKAA